MGFFDVAGAIINAFDVPAKEKGKAYARLIFGGLVGWHMFYMEKTLRGILYIVSFAVLMAGWFLHIPGMQYAGAGALVVFWLFDLITLGMQVNKWNATHETGNLIINRAGKAASKAISIPLENARKDYNGVVANYQASIEEFKGKKNAVQKLLNKLQKARKDALDMVSRMQQILTAITVKGIDVQDSIGVSGDFSAELNELLRGDSSMLDEIDTVIDSSTQEMQETFYIARDLTQTFEGKAGAYLAAGAAALSAIVELAKQQEKVAELNQRKTEVLQLQGEVETGTMQLEATEKRAQEILKVINAEAKAFDHIYDEFCAAVFPNGIEGQKDIKELTLEQRQMFNDLGHALTKVLAVIKQEIRQDGQRGTAVNRAVTRQHTGNTQQLSRKTRPSVPQKQSSSIPPKSCNNCANYDSATNTCSHKWKIALNVSTTCGDFCR